MVYAPCGQLTVSLLAEVPEDLHERLGRFMDDHPEWDQETVFKNALALFLMLHGEDGQECDRVVSRTYLDTLFGRAARAA